MKRHQSAASTSTFLAPFRTRIPTRILHRSAHNLRELIDWQVSVLVRTKLRGKDVYWYITHPLHGVVFQVGRRLPRPLPFS